MKQLKITLIILLFSVITTSAQNTVEKSLFNFQTGTIGFWGSHEAKIGNKLALRTEIGFDLWYYDTFTGDDGSVLVPSISLEPRWYYNIAKRSTKGRTTTNNSANFFSINIEYYPDLFVIGHMPNYMYVPNQINIIPKWGIRRHIASSNFNYEAGFGIGYKTYLNDNDNKIVKSGSDVAIDIHLRIGYTF